MMSWLAPSIGFVAISGLIGITTKLALRGLPPTQLFLWAARAYAITGTTAIAAGVRPVVAMPATGLAVATGALAAAGLSVRFVALRSVM